jgi:hypothetical protein
MRAAINGFLEFYIMFGSESLKILMVPLLLLAAYAHFIAGWIDSTDYSVTTGLILIAFGVVHWLIYRKRR